MSKIIIGIHGLGNKPPRALLRKWWKRSIHDGLKRIGRNRLFFRFEIVYWADIINENLLDHDEREQERDRYIEEPYVPPLAVIDNKPQELRKKTLDFIEKQIDKIFLNDDMTVNYSFVTDMIIRHYFKEIDCYFSNNTEAVRSCSSSFRDAINMRLQKILLKHKGKEILLISHSMGTIIAYDVLRKVEHDITIDTFVTMGSPLGLPVIMEKLLTAGENAPGNKLHAITPENVVNNWYNFTDIGDKIAFNYNLGDDYHKNSRNVRAKDMIVYNDYTIYGHRNPHKSYGYLRTPELARVIDDFLDRRSSKPVNIITRWIDRIFSQ